jgi:hypothetical protein
MQEVLREREVSTISSIVHCHHNLRTKLLHQPKDYRQRRRSGRASNREANSYDFIPGRRNELRRTESIKTDGIELERNPEISGEL